MICFHVWSGAFSYILVNYIDSIFGYINLSLLQL